MTAEATKLVYCYRMPNIATIFSNIFKGIIIIVYRGGNFSDFKSLYFKDFNLNLQKKKKKKKKNS